MGGLPGRWVGILSALRPAGRADCGGGRALASCRPVRLPVAVVVPVSLLPARVVVVHLVPGVAHLHRLAGGDVLAVDLAVLAVEPADDGRLELAALAAHPVDRP